MYSTVNYLGPETDRPEIYLFDPPPGVPKQFPTVGHEMQVANGREQSEGFRWDREGFELLHDPDSVIDDFYDEQAIVGVYFAKVSELIKRSTGASEVVIFDHTYRSSRDLEPGESNANQPVMNAHSDYTNDSGPGRAMDVAGDLHAKAIEEQRYRMYNVWRPINGTVEQKPLALCDIRAMTSEEFVPAVIRFPNGRVGGVMAIRHSDAHRWVYFPDMTTEEVILLQSFDPRAGGARRFGAHCAVDLPGMTGNERIRESLEIRAVAIFDD
jgi:hypothetical protein